MRNVWALAAIVFVAFVGFQFFSPFLPLYVAELGVTDPGRVALWSGALAAVTPAVSGMLGPFFGRLADRFGRKLMLVRSLVAFTVIIAAMGLVTSVEQLFAARLLQRVGLRLASPFRYGLRKVCEKHGEPEPDRDGKDEPGRRFSGSSQRLREQERCHNTADPHHEHDRILDLVAGIQFATGVGHRLPDDLPIKK